MLYEPSNLAINKTQQNLISDYIVPFDNDLTAVSSSF